MYDFFRVTLDSGIPSGFAIESPLSYSSAIGMDAAWIHVDIGGTYYGRPT